MELATGHVDPLLAEPLQLAGEVGLPAPRRPPRTAFGAGRSGSAWR